MVNEVSRGRATPEIRASGDRRVLGMPGPVWTMALWFAAACMILVLSLLFPMNPNAKTLLRTVVLIYTAVVVVALLVMRARTPTWFLHVQTCVSIVASLWIVYGSVTPSGAITSAISIIVIAAYMGFWMPRNVALAYMLVTTVALFVLLAVSDRIPELLVPWALICSISIGLVVSFGTLVANMNRQLVTDPLTGLLNRSGMVTLVDRRGEASRSPAPRALMVIDLDQFKVINDRDGHLAGDRALTEFGAALRGVIRPGDFAFRSGGDEFFLILPRTDIAAAEALAGRLRGTSEIEWSYGLTEWTTAESFDTALARADQRMYQQKAERSGGR